MRLYPKFRTWTDRVCGTKSAEVIVAQRISKYNIAFRIRKLSALSLDRSLSLANPLLKLMRYLILLETVD